MQAASFAAEQMARTGSKMVIVVRQLGDMHETADLRLFELNK